MPAPDGAILVPFPRFARNIHRFADYLAEFPQRDLQGEVIEGRGLAGPAKWVKSLTGDLRIAQPANNRYVSVIHTMAQMSSASMTAALP